MIKNLKQIVNWISTSFQNKEGKVCSKRTTVFAMVIMLGYIVFFELDNINSIAGMTILSGGVLSILGVKDYFDTKKVINDLNDARTNKK